MNSLFDAVNIRISSLADPQLLLVVVIVGWFFILGT